MQYFADYPVRRAGARHHPDPRHALKPVRLELIRHLDMECRQAVRLTDLPEAGAIGDVMAPDDHEGIDLIDHPLGLFLAYSDRRAQGVDHPQLFGAQAEVAHDLAEILLRLGRLRHDRNLAAQFDPRRLLAIVYDGDFVTKDLLQRHHLGVPVVAHHDEAVALFHQFERQRVRPDHHGAGRIDHTHPLRFRGIQHGVLDTVRRDDERVSTQVLQRAGHTDAGVLQPTDHLWIVDQRAPRVYGTGCSLCGAARHLHRALHPTAEAHVLGHDDFHRP